MAKAQSVTSIGQSPEAERKSRMIKYTVAMVIRVVCIVLAMFVQGWLMWVCFAGAIVLPYFAVILANMQGSAKPLETATTPVAPRLSISAEAFKSSDFKSDAFRNDSGKTDDN